MRAIAAVLLLFGGHRNPFLYVEQPAKPVVVMKAAVSKQTVIRSPAGDEEKEKKKIIEIAQPPAFPYRCIGRFGPDANPFAVFDGGGAIINVRLGEVIDGTFVVRAIGIESVTIGVDGFPEQRVSIGAER